MKHLSKNDVVVLSCAVFVAVMVGMSFAAVPLYRLFCQATGYGGTPQRADAAPTSTDKRIITVRFDTNVDPAMPWRFQPEQREVAVHVGEQKLVYFRATNMAATAITGHAAFNVQPDNAARYFDKIQCFCFTEQKLEAHQSIEMPVVFFVDPKILADRGDENIGTITLSYTFYTAVTLVAGAGG
jgi:cytochrome c oxidase assembly protein subunit 11